MRCDNKKVPEMARNLRSKAESMKQTWGDTDPFTKLAVMQGISSASNAFQSATQARRDEDKRAAEEAARRRASNYV